MEDGEELTEYHSKKEETVEIDLQNDEDVTVIKSSRNYKESVISYLKHNKKDLLQTSSYCWLYVILGLVIGALGPSLRVLEENSHSTESSM